MATRRAAIPSALALGMLALGGAVSGSFTAPLVDARQIDGRGFDDLAHGPTSPPPALTARVTPSVEVSAMPPRADRGQRGHVIGDSFAAWPVIDQAATGGGAIAPVHDGTTTTSVRDRAPEPAVFAPMVLADPPDGARGGGGAAVQSSASPEAPSGDGGGWSGLFPPVGDGGRGQGPNPLDSNPIRSDAPVGEGRRDRSDRDDRRARDGHDPRGPGAGGGFGGSHRTGDAGGGGSRGGDSSGSDHGGNGGRSGRGGDGGRGGGRH